MYSTDSLPTMKFLPSGRGGGVHYPGGHGGYGIYGGVYGKL